MDDQIDSAVFVAAGRCGIGHERRDVPESGHDELPLGKTMLSHEFLMDSQRLRSRQLVHRLACTTSGVIGMCFDRDHLSRIAAANGCCGVR